MIEWMHTHPARELSWMILNSTQLSAYGGTEMEELFRQTFEAAPIGMAIISLDFRLAEVNQAFCEMLGYSRPELTQLSFLDITHPDDVEKDFQLSASVFKGDIPSFHLEKRYLKKDGQIVWASVTSTVIRDRTGRILYRLSMIQNITERKQAEESLASSEKELRAMFAAMTDVIIVYDAQGRYLQIAPTNPGMLIRPPAELLGRTVHEVLPQAEADYIVESIRLAHDKGQLLPVEYSLPIGGFPVRFEGTVSPLGEEKVFWIVRDVTERKRGEEALRESEERFYSAFEYAAIGMCLVSQDGHFLKVNRALCQLTGYAEAELLTRTFQDITHPDDLEADLAYKRRMLAREISTYQLEKRYLHKLGHVVWVLLSVSLVCDGQGQPLYLISQIQDITERRRIEAELHESNEKLTVWVNQLRQRSQEIALLSQMGDLLQSCRSVEEAYRVIARSARLLFPAESGALYVVNSSRNLVEKMAAWGDALTGLSVFAPDDCWALRRGRLFAVEDPGSEVLCAHLGAGPLSSYLCVPMMAQSEAIGVLYLRSGRAEVNSAVPGASAVEPFAASRQQLAVSVAEHVALSLASLNLRETLRSQALRDPLTGLFNRRYMEETITRELYRAARSAAPLGMIMFDVDHLKEFNDAFGHGAGDVLLRELGAHLQRSIRREDIACRYGGDEFILVLPDCSSEIAFERAERLREDFKTLELKYHGQILPMGSLSLGVAVFSASDMNAESLLHKADQAMYRAKSDGRDRVVVAD